MAPIVLTRRKQRASGDRHGGMPLRSRSRINLAVQLPRVRLLLGLCGVLAEVMFFPGQHGYCCPMQGSSQRQPGPRFFCPLPSSSLFSISQTSLPNTKPPALLTGPQHVRQERLGDTPLYLFASPSAGNFLLFLRLPIPHSSSSPNANVTSFAEFSGNSYLYRSFLGVATKSCLCLHSREGKEVVSVGLTAGWEPY